MGTEAGTLRSRGRAVSIHPDRRAWVVCWRDNGAQRARRFKTEAEALAFDEGVCFVFFSDPDGNRWAVQQISARG